MFRGLSSWLGLQQPVVDGRPVEEDGQPEGEAPPAPRPEAGAESAESELLHQAKDLGGESPVSGWGRKVCLLVGPLGTGELDEDLGKAGASSRSQIPNLKWLVTVTVQSVNMGSRAAERRCGLRSLGLTRNLFCSARQLPLPQPPPLKARLLESLSRLKK